MNIPKGFKQTDAGLIPDDWEVKKINEVCRLINGRGFKPYEWKSEGLPIIRIQNLNGSDEFNYYQGNYDRKIEVEDEQLLFAWSGSKGTSFGPHIWKGSLGLLNYHTWKVVVREREIVPSFFLHALEELTKIIEKKAHGCSALVHTQKWEMEGLTFSLPPTKAEQTAIAAALSDMDALIEGVEKLLEKKRCIKQGAMQELLKPKDGWKVKALAEIGDIITGGTPSTLIKEYWNGEIPWVTPTDITTKKEIYHTERALTSKGLSAIRKLPKNTLLVTCIASIGKNVILRSPGSCNQQINAIIPYSNFNIEFLYYLIEINKNILLEYAGITATLILSKKEFSGLEFAFPKTKNEQDAIAASLSDMDAEIEQLETQRTKYRQLKTGMMQDLLTGKKRLV